MPVRTRSCYCFYKATNGIKRHLAIDTLGFPFFTHCTPANVSDDGGLVEMLTHAHRLFQVKTCQHSKDHYPVRPRLPPGIFDSRVRADLSPDYDKNQV